MNLESCATINYVIEDREVNQITLTIEDTKLTLNIIPIRIQACLWGQFHRPD